MRKFVADSGFARRIVRPLVFIESLRMEFHHELAEQCNCSIMQQLFQNRILCAFDIHFHRDERL